MIYQKYHKTNEIIPQDRRSEINQVMLEMIESMNYSDKASKSLVFNRYTGKGGLHGLSRKNYQNYHQYSSQKKAIDNGQYFTSDRFCRFIVSCIQPREFDQIADLTCGIGSFFNYLPNEKNCFGLELDLQAVKVAGYLYPEARIEHGDLRFYHSNNLFDLVYGNAPFNLNWKVKGRKYTSQLFYFIKAFESLKPGGLLAVITPNSFLNDEFGCKSDIKTINERFNFICQFDLPKDAFQEVGVESFETKVLFFQKRNQCLPFQPYDLEKIEIKDISDETADEIFNYFIEPVKMLNDKLKPRLYFESRRSLPNNTFDFKVKKLLYDLKRNPKVNQNYQQCFDLVRELKTQTKPDNMTYEEWEEVKLTESKVLQVLNQSLKKQNYVEEEKTVLIKTKTGLRLKPYSQNQADRLSRYAGVKQMSFNDMILEDRYPFQDQRYINLVELKKTAFERQNIKLTDLPDNLKIREWLNDFTLIKYGYDLFDEEEVIRFNERQKSDLEKVFQKSYPPILNWGCGSGKTLAGVAWLQYLQLIKPFIRNRFVVSSAISINNTWAVELKKFDIPFVQIRTLKDIRNLRPNQLALISFDMLVTYQDQVKAYIKRQSQKVAVVVDESHGLINYNSDRTKATLNVFRRVHHKLLTTGSVTLNHINELYPQFELMYNNSINFLCNCAYIYRQDKEGEIYDEPNIGFNEPFPARKGNSLFKACFCPAKTSVFGIKRFNQDLYNSDVLTEIIAKSVLTRTFQEIVGEEKYEIIPYYVQQNEAEKDVYQVIVNEFYRIVNDYFENTGNSRKESGLRIIRQIQLLIKSTSVPHLMKEYQGAELPGKYLKIFDLIRNLEGQKVALGTLYVKAARDYFRKLQGEFPNRPIFLILGNVSFKKRAAIIKEFESTSNGILVSTQASLSESVNIPTVDNCIVEAIQWNIPKIFQYAFRFIRYNSKNFKRIIFVTCENTIEQNLLGLLMAKERLNEYIKTLVFSDKEDIFKKFNLDVRLLDDAMEKEVDQETGKVRLTWGQTKIS